MHKKKTTNLNTFSKGIPAMNIKTQNHRKSPQESQTYWIVYGVNTQINKYKNLHLYIYIYLYYIIFNFATFALDHLDTFLQHPLNTVPPIPPAMALAPTGSHLGLDVRFSWRP